MEEPVAIEMGPRDNPSINYLDESLVPDGSKVLSVDLNAGWLTQKNMSALGGDERTPDAQKIQGNAAHLMVKNNSIRTIYAKDMFGHQGNLESQKVNGKTTIGKLMEVGNFSDIANEWYRVCQEGGKAIVLETATPADRKALIKTFEEAGFKLAIYYPKEGIHNLFTNDPDRPEQSIMGKTIAEGAPHEAFALIFEKKT